VYEEKHRLIETHFAQVGAVLLSLGFLLKFGVFAVEGEFDKPFPKIS
jgi:hypothetical protein